MSSVWLLVGTIGHSTWFYYSLYNQNGLVHCLSARQPWKWHRTPVVTAMHHWWASYIIPLIKKNKLPPARYCPARAKNVFAGSLFPKELCVCLCLREWMREHSTRHMTNVFCLFLSFWLITDSRLSDQGCVLIELLNSQVSLFKYVSDQMIEWI